MASISTVPPEIAILIAKELQTTSPTASECRESWSALSRLSRTCKSFHSMMTPLLYQCGAQQTREHPLIHNPLHYLAATGNPVPIRRLAAYGADIDSRNESGESALHLAFPPAPPPLETSMRRESQTKEGTPKDDRRRTVAALIDAGADLNASNLPPLNIITPLTLALWSEPKGAYPIMEQLLEAGADAYPDTVAPWFRARLFEETLQFEMVDIMVLLIQHGWSKQAFREAVVSALDQHYKQKTTRQGERMVHWKAVVLKRREVAKKVAAAAEAIEDQEDAMEIDGAAVEEVGEMLAEAEPLKQIWRNLVAQEQNLRQASMWLKGSWPWLERTKSEEMAIAKDTEFVQRGEFAHLRHCSP